MNDMPGQNELSRLDFSLNPGERRYFAVVFKREGKEPRFYASYAVRSRPNSFEDGEYEFGILVTGENVPAQRLKLKVWIDEQGRLCMKEAS